MSVGPWAWDDDADWDPDPEISVQIPNPQAQDHRRVMVAVRLLLVLCLGLCSGAAEKGSQLHAPSSRRDLFPEAHGASSSGDHSHGSVYYDRPLSNCSCDMHPKVTLLLGKEVCNVPLVPAWLGAVVLGLVGGYKLSSLGSSVVGSFSYAVTYFTYAFMITSGLVVHCLYLVECGKATPTKGYADAGTVDASLTSCVAVSFVFNALVDLGIMREGSCATVITMAVTYMWTFVTYIWQLVPAFKLYQWSIVISCSLYLLAQLVLLIHMRGRGIMWLVLAGAVGGASMLMAFKESCWLCLKFGAWSMEGIWYYGSDVAMILVFFYIWSTRQKPTSQSHTAEYRDSGVQNGNRTRKLLMLSN